MLDVANAIKQMVFKPAQHLLATSLHNLLMMYQPEKGIIRFVTNIKCLVVHKLLWTTVAVTVHEAKGKHYVCDSVSDARRNTDQELLQ